MAWPMIVRSREAWMRHPERAKVAAAIKDLAPPGGWQVNNGFLLGLAPKSFVSVEGRFNNNYTRSPAQIRQLVSFVDTVSLVAQQSGRPIQALVQEDRKWTSLERDVLGAFNIGLVHPPFAEELAGYGSLVCLPFLPVWVRYGLLARCPTLQPKIIWIDVRWQEAEAQAQAQGDEPGVQAGAITFLINRLTRNLAGCESDIQALENPALYPNAPAVCDYQGKPMPEHQRRRLLARNYRERYIEEQRIKHLRAMRLTHVEINVLENWSLIARDPKKPLTRREHEVCEFCLDERYMQSARSGGLYSLTREERATHSAFVAYEKERFRAEQEGR